MSGDGGDWLDRALRSRPAQTAPSGFTSAVLRNVAPRRPRWNFRALVAEHGRPVGFAAAAGGVCSLLDPDVLSLAALAAATIGLAWSMTPPWRST